MKVATLTSSLPYAYSCMVIVTSAGSRLEKGCSELLGQISTNLSCLAIQRGHHNIPILTIKLLGKGRAFDSFRSVTGVSFTLLADIIVTFKC